MIYETLTIKIGGVEIVLSHNFPTEEGKYIKASTMFGMEVQMVTIHRYPETYNGGIKFDSYLGIGEYRGRPINVFDRPTDWWSEKIEL